MGGATYTDILQSLSSQCLREGPPEATSPEQRERLLHLTERYCVVAQTLLRSPELRIGYAG